MIVEHISELIGNTPLLKISEHVTGLKNINLYAKLETQNPFGSVKDRVAKALLAEAFEKIKNNNLTIVEASSGNTGKALAALAGTYGFKFKAVTNRIKQAEVRMTLQLLGAEIDELPGLSDCPDPNDPNDFTKYAANLAASQPDQYHYTDQYFNPENFRAHYETTGREILSDLKEVDYYFGFLGTCGSSIGVGEFLKDHGQKVEIYGVVTAEGHHVPGGRNINELWEVGLYRRDFFADILQGTSWDAIDGMLTLNRNCGLLCGPTAGLSYYAAINKLKEIDQSLEGTPRKLNAVFLACDRMESYNSYVARLKPEVFYNKKNLKPTIADLTEEEVFTAPKISASELDKKIQNEQPLLIDVRGNFAYSTGHISGAINILDEIFSMLLEQGSLFPKNKEIIIYCSIGVISAKFAAFLVNQGYNACSLLGGLRAWKELDFPVEKTLVASETPRGQS